MKLYQNIYKPKIQRQSTDGLTIGEPNDQYEQEADKVANQVMRMSKDDSLIQRKCTQCKEIMQRKEANGVPHIQADFNTKLQNSKGGGASLPVNTQQFMESRMGADFSNIRIHTGHTSEKMNREISARAFTHGSDIHFNRNEYQPESNSGKELLAHELTHTIQQSSGQTKIQRTCQDESHYRSSPDYCRDDSFSPSTHPGQTCYRQIPTRSSYWSCPAGEHVCFDTDGNCEDSPDRSSLAESKESDGSCNWNQYCVAEHTAVDFVPAVVDQTLEPFREIGREAMRALDWRNWYRFY